MLWSRGVAAETARLDPALTDVAAEETTAAMYPAGSVEIDPPWSRGHTTRYTGCRSLLPEGSEKKCRNSV